MSPNNANMSSSKPPAKDSLDSAARSSVAGSEVSTVLDFKSDTQHSNTSVNNESNGSIINGFRGGVSASNEIDLCNKYEVTGANKNISFQGCSLDSEVVLATSDENDDFSTEMNFDINIDGDYGIDERTLLDRNSSSVSFSDKNLNHMEQSNDCTLKNSFTDDGVPKKIVDSSLTTLPMSLDEVAMDVRLLDHEQKSSYQNQLSDASDGYYNLNENFANDVLCSADEDSKGNSCRTLQHKASSNSRLLNNVDGPSASRPPVEPQNFENNFSTLDGNDCAERLNNSKILLPVKEHTLNSARSRIDSKTESSCSVNSLQNKLLPSLDVKEKERFSSQELTNHSSSISSNNTNISTPIFSGEGRPLIRAHQDQSPYCSRELSSDLVFSAKIDQNQVPRVASVSEGVDVVEEISSRVRKRSRRRTSSSALRSCWSNKMNFCTSALRRFSRWCSSGGQSSNDDSKESHQSTAVNTLSSSLYRNVTAARGSTDVADDQLCFHNKETPLNRCMVAHNECRANAPAESPALSIKSFKGAVHAAASLATKGAKISPVDDTGYGARNDSTAFSSSLGGGSSRKKSNPSSSKSLPGAKKESISDSKLDFSSVSKETDLESVDRPSSSFTSSKADVDLTEAPVASKAAISKSKKSSKSLNDDDSLGLSEDSNGRGTVDCIAPVSSMRGDHMKRVRSRRLMKEFQELTKISQSTPNPVFSVALVNDCLFEWKVKLHRIDQDSFLHRDMVACGVPFILFSMTFPDNFPFQPPFLRVLSPRVEKGFVMEGGAICMELLTPRGWASAYTIEAIIMQLAASLVKGHARISRKPLKDFNQKAAEASFRSLVRTHEKYGWVTPPLADG
ncbi:uncharacterized protein LOC108668405 [Hyalella azteca]|uniref:E2 ubiquitin-conjugating enzyme n=1 Tax=Hyalella azteca TaxID=294128 RepID=A0A8B7NC44_HYAAZ|nr:uncharacterized protein LOC108668405 [Hyalella azteca]